VIGALAVLAASQIGKAQETVNGGTVVLGPLRSSGPQAVVDFTAAGSTSPVKSGTLATRPGSCTVGQMYFATDAAAGQNLTYCTSAGTWTMLAGGGTLDAAAIVSGAFAIARIPTGITAATVALGNHLHTGVYEPAITAGSAAQYLRGDKSLAAFAADSLAAVTWAAMTGKPSTFAPSLHAASHQFGGADVVSTVIPGANAIPQAGAGGTLAAGWVPTLNQNTTGNAATATALATLPAKCSAGNYPLGVDAGGNAQNCTVAGSGGGSTIFSSIQGGAAEDMVSANRLKTFTLNYTSLTAASACQQFPIATWTEPVWMRWRITEATTFVTSNGAALSASIGTAAKPNYFMDPVPLFTAAGTTTSDGAAGPTAASGTQTAVLQVCITNTGAPTTLSAATLSAGQITISAVGMGM